MSVSNATLSAGRKCKKLDTYISDAVSTVTCPSGSTACRAVWRENNNEIKFLKQGCLAFVSEGAPTDMCSESTCVAYAHTPPNVGRTYVCCCKSDYCNSYVSKGMIDTTTERYGNDFPLYTFSKDEGVIKPRDEGINLLIMLLVAAAFSISFAVACKKYAPRVINYMKSEIQERSDEENVISSTTFISSDVDKYLDSNSHVIYQGRYGKIYVTTVRPTYWSKKEDSTELCIKEFDTSNASGRQMYATEKKCYRILSSAEHRNVVKYYGCSSGRYTISKIMLGYCSRGSLRDCLRETTFDTTKCLEILRDVTVAIDFLHNPRDAHRCAIAHRDITSANFLVKSDWTVVVTDFGLSQILSKGDDNNTELHGVGTTYYLAPEILSGTCNLRFKNVTLKQTDVYSEALVIWEVASRCREFYKNNSLIPESRIPYVKETRNGQQLFNLVVEQGFRPIFPFTEDWFDGDNSTKSVLEYNINDVDSHHCNEISDQSDDQDSCSTVSTVLYHSEVSSNQEDNSSIQTNDSGSVATIGSEMREGPELSPKRLSVQKCAEIIVRSVKESWDADEDARLTSSTIRDRMVACFEEYSSLV